MSTNFIFLNIVYQIEGKDRLNTVLYLTFLTYYLVWNKPTVSNLWQAQCVSTCHEHIARLMSQEKCTWHRASHFCVWAVLPFLRKGGYLEAQWPIVTESSGFVQAKFLWLDLKLWPTTIRIKDSMISSRQPSQMQEGILTSGYNYSPGLFHIGYIHPHSPLFISTPLNASPLKCRLSSTEVLTPRSQVQISGQNHHWSLGF